MANRPNQARDMAKYASDKNTAGDRERKVFLVHGKDEAAKQAVARFMEKVGLKVIILHEMPSSGRTIIEKFEDYSYVSFAVVLLTADDVCQANAKAKSRIWRARQNVILELGYLLGRLGRKRVCCLYQNSVEIPSDYAGVIYVPMDEGGAWKLLLAREMKQANIAIDLNQAM